jgi:Flp pilus assembly protein TadD
MALARAYVQLARFDEATAEYQEAAKLSPKDPNPAVELADVYQATHRLADAQELLLKTTRDFSDRALAGGKLGMFYHTQGDWEKADAAYARAIKRAPKWSLILNNRAALALEGKGDLQEALRWTEEAIRITPTSVDFLDTRGMLLLRSKQLSAAEAVFRRALMLSPGNPVEKYHLALVLGERGRSEEAVKLLDEALKVQLFPEKSQAEALRAKLKAGVESTGKKLYWVR